MDRFYLLAPALLLLATFLVAFAVYCGLCACGRAPSVGGEVKHNQLFGPFLARFLVWVIGPLERVLVGRVSPNLVTAASLAFCGLTGLAIGLGELPRAVWLVTVAGILDVLDGRLARLTSQQTAAGALFDSVSDRWGELFVFAGYAWFLHDSAWLLAVVAAFGGSMMVSYTRARAEALGVTITTGVMQRAERVVLVAGGTLVAAWFGASADGAELATVAPIIGTTLLVCGVLSTGTAINRWRWAYRVLASRDAVVEPVEPVARPTESVPIAKPALAPFRARTPVQPAAPRRVA